MEVCKGRNNLIITGNKGKGFFLSEGRDERSLPSGIYEIYAVIKQILVLDNFAEDNEFRSPSRNACENLNPKLQLPLALITSRLDRHYQRLSEP
jgi:hypothetical protein